jgi:hypothetical protein
MQIVGVQIFYWVSDAILPRFSTAFAASGPFVSLSLVSQKLIRFPHGLINFGNVLFLSSPLIGYETVMTDSREILKSSGA